MAIDCVDEIIEHQKIFMEVVSDIRSSSVFTFPVLTYSLLYKDGEFVDKEFARWCSDHNTKWNDSNFFISGDVTTLSNCCFDGSQQVLVKIGDDVKMTTFKSLHDNVLDGIISEFSVWHMSDWKPAHIVRLPGRPMYHITACGNIHLFVTDNHLNPTGRGDVRTCDLTTDDVLRWYEKRTSSGADIVRLIKINNIERCEATDDYCYCFEMEDQSEPYFTLPNGIITHNCRLLSDTSKLSGFINSVGGTALSIGSVKVNTINLMRVAYESKGDIDAFLSILEQRTRLCCQVLDVQRHIIQRNIEKGLLPNYQDGGVEMSKQYSTVGILGLYECVEALGFTATDEFGYISYTDDGIEFASKVFGVLNHVKDTFTNDFSFNIESVPAERAAVILCQKDNLLYGKHDKFIYSNQWIPLSAKCTLSEKLRLSSILDAKCSGGAIAHINLESNFPDKDTAWAMLNRIAQAGVIYFAFNTKINECKNHHGFVGTDICPTCGEPVFDTLQRIVGYITPSRSYSKDRFREFNTRRWYSYAEMLAE